MTWTDLVQPRRWKCGHAKTPENTYRQGRRHPMCLTCKRAYARDYLKRGKEMGMGI